MRTLLELRERGGRVTSLEANRAFHVQYRLKISEITSLFCQPTLGGVLDFCLGREDGAPCGPEPRRENKEKRGVKETETPAKDKIDSRTHKEGSGDSGEAEGAEIADSKERTSFSKICEKPGPQEPDTRSHETPHTKGTGKGTNETFSGRERRGDDLEKMAELTKPLGDTSRPGKSVEGSIRHASGVLMKHQSGPPSGVVRLGTPATYQAAPKTRIDSNCDNPQCEKGGHPILS